MDQSQRVKIRPISNEQKTAWVGWVIGLYKGDYTAEFFSGTIINYYKDHY